jgi:hypothetical protein
MLKPKYHLRHEFINLTDEKRNFRSDCHGILFTNQNSSGTVLITVNNSTKSLAAGGTMVFNTNSPEVLITTVFDLKPGTAAVNVFVAKEFLELAD